MQHIYELTACEQGQLLFFSFGYGDVQVVDSFCGSVLYLLQCLRVVVHCKPTFFMFSFNFHV